MRKTLRFANREEWLESRRNGIGASEIGTLLGVNPYESTYELWQRKKGLVAPKEENFAMKAGHYLEDAVSQFFADATGATIIKSSKEDFQYMDTDCPHLLVSPDRTYWAAGAAHNEANKCILECKTTQRTIDAEDIPETWFCQVQTLLGVAGMKNGSLAWLSAGREFGQIQIPFVPDFFATIKEEVERFWTDYIIGDAEPEATTIRDVVAKYARSSEGKIIDCTEEVFNTYKDLKEVKRQLAELEEKKDELESVVKVALKDAEALKYGGKVIASWKSSKDSVKFDAKRYQAEHADLCEPYMVTTIGSRRFTLK